MIMELELRDLIKCWISRKVAWRLDDFTLAAICFADDVVLIAVSVSAAETMVSEAIEKTARGWTDGWRTENTLDEFPEDDGQKRHGGRIGCGVGGSFGVCGIDGVSGRECKTCDRTQDSSSQQMPRNMETCVEFPMAPQIVAVAHREDYDVAGFPLELECLDDGQGTEILSWAGHVARMDYKEICAKALGCRGLHWWRWRQLNWKEVERDKWSGPHPQRFKIYRWEDMVAGEVSKYVGNADGLSKTVQDNTGWLHFAQNRGKLDAVLEMGKEPCIDGPGCFGDPSASGMTGTNAVVAWLTERRIVRERFDEHLQPSRRIKPIVTLT